MQTIEIYTKPTCGFCHAAKRLLTSKGAEFTEIDIAQHPERRGEMISRASGGSTVPQIFVGDIHVGGCDELMALERAGKLDPPTGDGVIPWPRPSKPPFFRSPRPTSRRTTSA